MEIIPFSERLIVGIILGRIVMTETSATISEKPITTLFSKNSEIFLRRSTLRGANMNAISGSVYILET